MYKCKYFNAKEELERINEQSGFNKENEILQKREKEINEAMKNDGFNEVFAQLMSNTRRG